MDLIIKFKPRKYTIYASNMNSAYSQMLYKLPAAACFTIGTRGNGSRFNGRLNIKSETLFVYNVEVFKRGKHKLNKHYDFYVYSIPMTLLDTFKMDVHQNMRNFTIKML
jgi:hypothetical protein